MVNIKIVLDILFHSPGNNYIFFEGSFEQEVFGDKPVCESCYFYRSFCTTRNRIEIEKSSGGLKQLVKRIIKLKYISMFNNSFLVTS